MKDAPMRPPRLMMGGIYSRQNILDNLGIGPSTLTKWIRSGLPVFACGTNRQYFLADDIVFFLEAAIHVPICKTEVDTMSDNTKWINRRVANSEITNPLGEILRDRHEDQIREIDQYLNGIGYLDDTDALPGLVIDADGRDRPATDDESSIVNMEWTMELSVNVTRDLPAQVAEQLAKLARRMMRAAKRIDLAASAGEFSTECTFRRYAVQKNGEIIGEFPTKSAAVLHAMRHDGKWFEVTEDDAE